MRVRKAACRYRCGPTGRRSEAPGEVAAAVRPGLSASGASTAAVGSRSPACPRETACFCSVKFYSDLAEEPFIILVSPLLITLSMCQKKCVLAY